MSEASELGQTGAAATSLVVVGPLPSTAAILYAIPMNIKNGTGAPARVFAILPD